MEHARVTFVIYSTPPTKHSVTAAFSSVMLCLYLENVIKFDRRYTMTSANNPYQHLDLV